MIDKERKKKEGGREREKKEELSFGKREKKLDVAWRESGGMGGWVGVDRDGLGRFKEERGVRCGAVDSASVSLLCVVGCLQLLALIG